MEDNRLTGEEHHEEHSANKDETSAGATKSELVSIASLKPDPKQPRKIFANLHGLAETIKLHGIMQPIVVDENLTILFGERRWRAAKLAGLQTVPVIVRKSLAPDERLTMQLVEDVQEEDLSPLERAAAWDRMKKPKSLTNLELAKLLGVSERHVYRVLSLNSLPAEMRAALEQEKLSATQLMEIRSLPLGEQMEVFRECIASIASQGFAKNYGILKDGLSQIRKRLWKGRQKSRGFIGKDMLRLLGADVSATNRGVVVTQGKGESMEHFIFKAMVYKVLKDLGRETGCEMEVCGSLADIADLSSGYVYEIESNPSPSKVLRKVEAFKGLSGFRDVLVIDLRKLPEGVLKSVKEAEAFLRARIV